MTVASSLYIGLMSGTSLDGVDGVLVDFSHEKPLVARVESCKFAPDFIETLAALQHPGDDELHRAALAANALARVYAQVVHALLAGSGLAAREVRAIGAHGQTVRHRPGEFDGDAARGVPAIGYTLQLNNPALLAELTGIDVVADFRSRDLAAGGQGAPLVPAFHQAVFGRAGQTIGVLNLGGIANLSVLAHDGAVGGFDCGPANGLMDLWCQRHTGQPFDRDGAWAASGTPLAALLSHLLAEPYLAKAPPKSTGRDLFNADWLARQLQPFTGARPMDVQATLTEFTAQVCANDVRQHAAGAPTLIVCGGGAYNTHLMQRLQAALPDVAVESSALHGLAPLEVEATAFAWLARQTLHREPGNLPSVTGARGARVLGAIWPA
ncbi:MAG: anhydro-N-acetylmuramic acid kinase [Burkholderiales bacterium]|nr:anhydro-N-acetylmuramic acid kinase [Burkholderiales bacterium]